MSYIVLNSAQYIEYVAMHGHTEVPKWGHHNLFDLSANYTSPSRDAAIVKI